jgi:hypothetical protein
MRTLIQISLKIALLFVLDKPVYCDQKLLSFARSARSFARASSVSFFVRAGSCAIHPPLISFCCACVCIGPDTAHILSFASQRGRPQRIIINTSIVHVMIICLQKPRASTSPNIGSHPYVVVGSVRSNPTHQHLNPCLCDVLAPRICESLLVYYPDLLVLR